MLTWRDISPRALALALIGGVLGCAPAGCIPPTSQAAARPSSPASARSGQDRVATSLTVVSAEPPAHLANVPDDALKARVVAQRAVLGRHAPLFEDEYGRPAPWLTAHAPLPVGDPSFDEELLASLPGSSGLGGGASAESINGNSLGLFEAIEVPSDRDPFEHFYAALRRLRAGEDPDGKVRILMYGASHTDADVYPHYLRRYLQERFGDGGHGFVQVAKPWAWYGHVEAEVEGGQRWKTEHAQRSQGRDDGYYGLLGASLATKQRRAYGRVTLRRTLASRYELMYLQQPRGGSFSVVIDGKTVAVVKTRGQSITVGYRPIVVGQGQHTIEVRPRGDGEVRIFGMTVENDQPGVVVDTLGIGGSRASNMLQWNREVWADNVRRRAPDLYVLAYGTNEATDEAQPLSDYEASLREVLSRFAEAAPEASCLLVGPGDFPLKTIDEVYVSRPRLSAIISIQARVAQEVGCGFWDAQAFMGGELSMTRWVAAQPAMAKSDHIHLTRRGYTRMGMALTDALMVEFDERAAGPSAPRFGSLQPR